MNTTRLPLATVLALLIPCLSGCDPKPTAVTTEPSRVETDPVAKTKTFETARVGAAIDGFEREPTDRNSAAVKKAFAELDGEIAELHERIAKTVGEDRDESAVKARNLESYRTSETLRFTKAQVGLGGTPAADGRTGAEKIEDGARRAGQTVEDAAKRAGEAVEGAAKKAGEAVKDATK